MHTFEGIFLITGEHGTGKTRASVEAGKVEKTLLVDDDVKGRGTVRRIREDLKSQDTDIGGYIDFIKRTSGKSHLEIYNEGIAVIDNIKKGDYDVIVWDTWTRFAASIISYISVNMSKFTPPNGWSSHKTIKSGERYKVAKQLEAEILAGLQKKVPLVILVSHLKNQYKNTAPTGKQIPAVSTAIDRITDLRLWIRHNPKYSTPIALVLKNIEINVLNEYGRLRTLKVFPTRITPQIGEKSIWDAMARYYNDPIGDRPPTAEETPNKFENSIVHGTLTEDQRLGWLYAMKRKDEEAKEDAQLQKVQILKSAKEMQKEGKSFPQIAIAINEEFGTSLTIPQVADMLK